MKKIILYITLFCSLFSYSQSQNYDYIGLTKPTPDNKLSNYFKNAIPAKLLKNLRYPAKKQNIILSFYINKTNEPYKVTSNVLSNISLYNAINKAFLNYPLENLGNKNFDSKNKYSLQIIIRKNQFESVFSCSSLIVTEEAPVCESCNDLEFYEDITNCINSKIKNHFDKNLDSVIIKNAKKDIKNLKAKFILNEQGKLNLKKDKNSDLFLDVANNFESFEIPAKLNGKPTNYTYTYYPLMKRFPSFSNKSKDIGLIGNTTNNFAKFISEKLEPKYIDNVGLNRINKTLSLFFELDKKGKPFNISTNSRSQNIENRIIQIFKEYPIKNLNLGDRKTLSTYFSSILSYKDGNVIIETFPKFFNERVPLFPGCKRSKSISEAKKCFSKSVQMHFSDNFDTKLPNRLGLSRGRKRVFIAFTINKKGKIEKIIVRAPHPKIKEEVINVMQTLPKVKPATQNDKPVNVKYSIPFTLIVE